MLNPVLLATLAKALVSAEPDAEAIAARLTHVLGRKWRWISPLAKRYLQAFDGSPRPRRREVVSFLRHDAGLAEACRKHSGRIKLQHWIAGSPSMQPVAAAKAWAIPPIETVGALAEWSGLTPSQLEWFADLKGLGYKRPQLRLEHYHYRILAKAAGSIRLIETPKPRLKQLQQQILSAILDRIPSHPAVHGFVKGRSIQTFAAPHVGQRVLLRMDLQDFFPTFAGARVQSFFRTVGYPEPVADLLGGLVTNAVPQRAWRDVSKQTDFPLSAEDLWHVRSLYARPHLPQGAPTSPSLANLCSYRLDCRLAGLAASASAVYTRYADDLAFSGGERFHRAVERFATYVTLILAQEGFTVHPRKTRIMRSSVRQHLAGMVTNQRLNPPRKDFDALKAILTNCIRHGPADQNREAHPNFREHLAGRISFIASIHAGKGSRLRALFDKIAWGN
jgi:hypothetical protein